MIIHNTYSSDQFITDILKFMHLFPNIDTREKYINSEIPTTLKIIYVSRKSWAIEQRLHFYKMYYDNMCFRIRCIKSFKWQNKKQLEDRIIPMDKTIFSLVIWTFQIRKHHFWFWIHFCAKHFPFSVSVAQNADHIRFSLWKTL